MRSKVFKDFNDLKVLNEPSSARENQKFFCFSTRLFAIWLRPIYSRSGKSKELLLFPSLIRNLAPPNILPLGNAQINLALPSLIRIFVSTKNCEQESETRIHTYNRPRDYRPGIENLD